MSRDIDHIINRVEKLLPDVEVWQHQVRNPAVDDDGIWWFALPRVKKNIQAESSSGNCPFMIEHDDMRSASEAEFAHSTDEAIGKIVSYLRRVRDESARN